MTASLEALLAEGALNRVFQHANAVVIHEGKTVFAGGTTDLSARFDLASLTKVMATTALCCALKIELELKVGDVFPHAASASVTVADLLTHRSGLPAFEPFFALHNTREATVAHALKLAPIAPPGTASVYSDIGFIILGELISTLYTAPLDELFLTRVAKPLGLTTAHYRPLNTPHREEPLVSTGGTRPREPAPGQEGLWPPLAARPSRIGDVDDDNAYVMNGVSGHAGLFASARDVAHFGQAVLEQKLQLDPRGWPIDRETPNSTRTFGFDTPSKNDPSCGHRFGPYAIGHLGFTGTSVWVDFKRRLVIALLTNRVIYGRANIQIRQFRPRFHDAVLDQLAL